MPAKYLKIANKLQEDIFDSHNEPVSSLPNLKLRQVIMSADRLRNALAVLVSNGLIERRQGSGSRIESKRKIQKATALPSLLLI